jgi:Predicted nucleotide-binding protein containing TIR-like domain
MELRDYCDYSTTFHCGVGRGNSEASCTETSINVDTRKAEKAACAAYILGCKFGNNSGICRRAAHRHRAWSSVFDSNKIVSPVEVPPKSRGLCMKPKVFVGSSSEGLAIAKAVCAHLRRETKPTHWDRLFLPSSYPLETLEEQVTNHPFAVLVASPDDVLIKRGKLYAAMRDNLLLEFGLFVGALGRRQYSENRTAI